MSQNTETQIHFYQGTNALCKNKNYIDSDNKFIINEDSKEPKIIEAIRAKIIELFNMKNVSFLFGSGTSAGAIPTMADLYNSVFKKLSTTQYKELKKEFQLIVSGCKTKNNLEEILGVLYSNRVYLETIPDLENTTNIYKKIICNNLISIIEETIFNEINVNITEKQSHLELYKAFYSKVALRNKDLSRINIFTTNNDLFNEYALDQLNINYINGFGGGISKFFNPAFFKYTYSKRMDTSIDKFEPVENMVYLYKIHGSINWVDTEEKENIFFPVKEVPIPTKDNNSVLIYPAPTKQNKSLGTPYVELFREFQTKLLDPNSVLFVVGYSFSDEHVNNIINQALATNSSLTLVILNDVSGKYIDEIKDNRIFKIFGKIKNEDDPEKPTNIHYFDYIVNNLIPDLDTNKEEKDNLEKFINALKKSGNEDR